VTLRIHFAVLAHRHEACVADLVLALREANPGCAISIFNGGSDTSFFRNQDVDICPNSMQLGYGNLTGFHIGVMRWLHDSKAEYDALITLDHDVYPLRADMGSYLEKVMSDVGYLGARFRPAVHPADFELGGKTIAQVHDAWTNRWQPLFGIDQPYWAFNPGQVFTRDTVEKILEFPRLDALFELSIRSKVWAIEEIVYPTLAVAAGAVPADLPGERGLQWANHGPADLVSLAQDPDVYLVHRLTMSLLAPDRLAARALLRGETVDADLLEVPAVPPWPPMPQPPLLSVARVRGFFRWHWNEWQLKHRG
jgi:hypothetical protein